MCTHYSITKNQAAMQDLFKVAHNTTGAAAVRRAKVLKLVEPKEAPVQKPDKHMVANFLAKVGAGKQVLEFHRISTCSSKAMSPTLCFTFKKARSSLLSFMARKQSPRY
jgi:hypothetical protein